MESACEKMVEFEGAKWPRQIIAAAIWGVLAGWLDYLFHHRWLPHLVITVWPNFGLFSVSGIWFGAWGILAAYIGNTISSMSLLGFTVSAAQSLGTVCAVLIPAWGFRRFKGDPRIKTSRDGVIFMVFGVFLSSLASTLIVPPIWYHFGFIPNMAALLYVVLPGWFIGSTILNVIVGFPTLMLFSELIIKAKAYCKGWIS